MLTDFQSQSNLKTMGEGTDILLRNILNVHNPAGEEYENNIVRNKNLITCNIDSKSTFSDIVERILCNISDNCITPFE